VLGASQIYLAGSAKLAALAEIARHKLPGMEEIAGFEI
jgi:hypothetical protein